MPIYVYDCKNCNFFKDVYTTSYSKREKEIDCPVCTSKMVPVISGFNTSDGMMKKLSGVDDTDDLTLGKLIANKGIPAEHKRKIDNRIDKFNKGKNEYAKRKAKYKFEENGRTN
jgi:putative FmdB family regulatory protein